MSGDVHVRFCKELGENFLGLLNPIPLEAIVNLVVPSTLKHFSPSTLIDIFDCWRENQGANRALRSQRAISLLISSLHLSLQNDALSVNSMTLRCIRRLWKVRVLLKPITFAIIDWNFEAATYTRLMVFAVVPCTPHKGHISSLQLTLFIIFCTTDLLSPLQQYTAYTLHADIKHEPSAYPYVDFDAFYPRSAATA